ncbi:MAG: inositol oxygenase [Chlamydiae bacterium CG10_big_fil_rev_8_21_14_0_10_42_34]|nr:MAG: inositol oxygenase [Chlamydiae bacterium CG10_big_fil_rev_8_21_14_0_10_42_34]
MQLKSYFYFACLFFCLAAQAQQCLSGDFCTVQEWEEHVKGRPTYKDKESYRIYNENTAEHVKDFYRLNHKNQTLDFVLQKKGEYLCLKRGKLGIWQALDLFDQIVDESDPDLGLPQRYHLFQTAERLRKDNHPRWLILTGFIHDLGKILALYGEPQWAVVGDTFPVGCAFSKKIVFSEYFEENPDMAQPLYQSKYGIYSPHCGLDNVHMSWGHDEYLYHVLKNDLPQEALYIIRYHSFYSAHREGEYEHLMNEYDLQMLPYLQTFSQYDLYSKSEEKLDIQELLPFYKDLILEFLPNELSW